MRDLTIDQIEQSPPVLDALAWPFDFSIRRRPRGEPWFRIPSDENAVAIAGDASGGVFCRVTTLRHPGAILYVSSEGQSGVIGSSLPEWLEILVALPCWASVLHFSGGGQLAEMLRAVEYLQADAETRSTDWQSPRKIIVESLELATHPEPVQSLHRNVRDNAGVAVVASRDGWRCEGLFGGFTVSDNPPWKTSGPGG